uniref:Uncharacterized protein n=1 Tax=Anopheles albimanus TaxID=7167 RepID=A0A182FIW6_ANOAL
MFWILRRTGAVNLFNSINGNGNTAKTGSNHSNNSEKSKPRPPRKAYGRLSVESDDAQSKTPTVAAYTAGQLGIMGYRGTSANCTTSANSNGDGNGNRGCMVTADTNAHDTTGTIRGVNHISNNNQPQSNGQFGRTEHTRLQHTARHTSTASLTAQDVLDDNRNHGSYGEIDLELELNINHIQRKQSLSQLHPMELSDDDDYIQLSRCSGCDSLFPTLMLLEHHKEEFEHWSDYEDNERLPCCRRNRLDDEDYTDTETATSDAESEDLERLL